METIEARITFLRSEQARTDIDEVTRLKIKNELLREEDRLRALILGRARDIERIIGRGISTAIAAGFKSDEVNSAMNSMVRGFGDILAAETSKSLARSMAASGGTRAAIGLATGGISGLISGLFGFVANKLFGDRSESDRQVDAVEDNTIQLRALNDNIRDLTTLFINAPANFAISPGSPGFTGGGAAAVAGGGAPVSQSISRSLTISPGAIQINQQSGQSGGDVAQQVQAEISRQWELGVQSEQTF